MNVTLICDLVYLEQSQFKYFLSLGSSGVVFKTRACIRVCLFGARHETEITTRHLTYKLMYVVILTSHSVSSIA